METLVLPNITDEYVRERARDELPQSGSGRTIMTAEPKFVPENAVSIELDASVRASVRLIDSVGYMIPGANGQYENGEERLVKQRLSSVHRISLAYERLSESPDLISSVLHNDIQNLKHTEEMIDRDAFYRAVDLIGDARKIYVIGGRSCSTLASFLNYYLSYIFDDVRLIRSDSVTE